MAETSNATKSEAELPMTSVDTLGGQWIGQFAGTNRGLCVLDVDETDDGWSGHGFAFDDDRSIPNVMIGLRTEAKALPFDLTSRDIVALHPTEARILNPEALGPTPNDTFPNAIDLHFETNGDKLAVAWSSNIGTVGNAELARPDARLPSNYQPIENVSTWDDFLSFALGLPAHQFIFRGQGSRHRLRTSFHRTRRKDLVRYLQEDLQNAHHVLTAQTNHLFRLNDPIENGAFLNLLQHHGFPTPLLDWTYSPFVAAFFAYRFGRRRPTDDEKVRIFVFDKAAWISDFSQIQSIAFAQPHFSVIEALTLENPRALPQQSISTVTNVDDIETYIALRDDQRGKTYLRAIDLPYVGRRRVMEQLRKMGITAGSLFPGLDGACEELRGRFFHPLA